MTLKMTSAQVVETSVIVNNNSSFQNYTNPDDHTQQTTKLYLLFPLFCSTGCPKSFYFTNNSGDLQSPRPHGALLYPDNIRCEWSITIPDQILQVKLSFNTFDLEECHECKCDYVEVFDNIGAKRISFGRFCGSVLPGPFFSSEQTLSVVFKSDHGDSSSGFTASYSPVLPGAGALNKI